MFVKLVAAVMKQLIVFVGRISEQSYQFSSKLVGHSQIEWPKIVVEWVILKFVVNIEKVGILIGCGRPGTRNEIKTILNHLNNRVLSKFCSLGPFRLI